MLIEHRGQRPRIHPSAYVAPSAVISGDVAIGPECRILHGAVLTAESGAIEIGESCIVMEQALIRGRDGHPARLGDHVLLGPHAHLNGAEVERESFLATGVSVFPGARVGRGSELRINSVVHANTVVRPETVLPIGWIAAGDPAELFSPDRHEELWEVQKELDFPGTVFGLPREEASMKRIASHYAELFGAHRDDRVIEE